MDCCFSRWRQWTGGLLLAIACLGWSPGAAQAQQVRTHVSADSVYVGERFTLSLVARHRFTTAALFPDSTASFGDLTVLGRSASSYRYLGAADPGARVDSIAYTVTTFALDSARVPALPVRFAADGDTTAAAASPRLIPVRSVVPDDAAELRGLAAPMAFPEPRWPWAVLALVALVLLGGAYYYWRERQASAEAPMPPDVDHRSSYEIATDRLDALALPPEVATADTVKRFYVDLTRILRTYLAGALGVAAMERTSHELLATLRGHKHVPPPALQRIRRVLEQADPVKFADATPAPEAHPEALRQTRAAIEAIEQAARPEPTPEDEDGEIPTRQRARHEST